MEDIAKAFSDFYAHLQHLKHLRANGQIAADVDLGQMAFQSALAFSPPYVITAFVSVLEMEMKRIQNPGDSIKRRRSNSTDAEIAEIEASMAQERVLYERAKSLASQFAQLES